MTPEIKQRIDQIRRGEVPEGYKKTKVGVVPCEWEETTVGKCVSEYVEKTTIENQYPLLTSARSGLMLQSEYYSNNQVTTNENVGYNVLPRGYVTYRSRSDDGRFRFNENQIIDKGIISYFYPVFSFNANVSHSFMLYLLNHTIYRQSYSFVEGTAQQVLSFKKLCSLKYCIPTLAEQEKIAEILSTQDKLIELKEKLIEEKKKQKKALMQKLLTGKTRLPGFCGDWKKQKISDILFERKEENVEQNLRICSVAVNSGVVDQFEHLGKNMAANDTSNYNVVHYGDIVYTKSPTGAFPYGIVKQSQLAERVAVSPLYGVYKPTNYEIGYLLNEYFMYSNNTNGYLLPIVNKGAKNTINISNSTFISPSLYLPVDFDEINKLVIIFKTANKEIEMIQKELDQEKQKKKALMQLLLTGIVRV